MITMNGVKPIGESHTNLSNQIHNIILVWCGMYAIFGLKTGENYIL